MITSLEFSKQLKENGCELKSEQWWRSPCKSLGYDDWSLSDCQNTHSNENIPAYDILNDICVKYAIPFFKPKIGVGDVSFKELTVRFTTQEILLMLQQQKPREEIEKYIWDNCLFNPKNN